jgi:hypothetical protein
MQVILQTTHIELRLNPELHLISFRRTSERLKDLPLAEANYQQAVSTLDQFDRSQYKLLVDLRDSPLRNDPSFENFVAKYRMRLFSGFIKTAILVKTAVGELQMNRLAREGKLAVADNRKIFREEHEALAYLNSHESNTDAHL